MHTLTHARFKTIFTQRHFICKINMRDTTSKQKTYNVISKKVNELRIPCGHHHYGHISNT